MFAHELERLGAARRATDDVASTDERVGDEREYARFVVDDEDLGRRCRDLHGARRTSMPLGSGSRRHRGQRDAYDRSATRRRVDIDPPLMARDDPVAHGETEARSLDALCREERLEDPALDLLVHPDAGVRDANDD